ncbi:MAG: energy-coupling factor transporter transmembrane component T [Lentihominibacter sp.]|jgi:energy-coupling factor transport system permease protein
MKFDSYHPAINLIYFVAAIGCAFAFNHPVFVAISFAAAFAYSVKLNGLRGLVFNLCLIPVCAAYVAWYSYYTHFGVTVLSQNFVDNNITLEAILYGIQQAFTAAAFLMFMSCVFSVISSDKVVYLFGKVSPKLSLFLSILLRTVPRVKTTVRRINVSRGGVGRGTSGNGLGLIARLRNALTIISITITWTLESFLESSLSMKSRGYTLKGRTAFSIYRFDNRDRSFVIFLFICLTLIAMAIMLDQTRIIYDPIIYMNRITRTSCIFYLAYAAMLIMPMILQIAGEIRFAQLRKSAIPAVHD